MFCPKCGKVLPNGSYFCSGCGKSFNDKAIETNSDNQHKQSPVNSNNPYNIVSTNDNQASGNTNVIEAYRKLSEYEKISGIIWLAIGIIQCLSIVGIICGIWNIIVATQRLKYSKELEQIPSGVYENFRDSLTSTVIILVINIVFGAIIGIVGAIFDLFVRNYVMEHSKIFTDSNHNTVNTTMANQTQQHDNSNNYLTNIQTNVNKTITASDLKEYKELLDLEIITQEEFDAKKKLFLG